MGDEGEFRGGLRNQRGNVTWPFAVLTVTREAIRTRSPLGTVVIHAGEAVHICEHRGLLSDGVRFTRESPLRWPLIFWTRRPQDVLAALRRFGWQIGHADDGYVPPFAPGTREG